MRAPDEIPQPPPPPPPPLPLPVPEQLAEQLEQRPEERTCYICLDDIAPNEAVTNCNACSGMYHTRHLNQWVITQQQQPTCPNCRGDMSWFLNAQQIAVAAVPVHPVPVHPVPAPPALVLPVLEDPIFPLDPNDDTPTTPLSVEAAELPLTINNYNPNIGLL